MSYYDTNGRSSNPPKSYFDQAAEARARQQRMFDYWNSTLIPLGRKKY